MRKSKARAACAALKHLWGHPEISLKLKGFAYCTAARLVLLHGSETCSLRAWRSSITKVYVVAQR